MMKIIENRVKFISFSLVIILSGFLAMFVNGFMNNESMLNFGIEFTGGTVMKVDIGKEFDKEEIRQIVYDITKSEDIQIQRVQNENSVIIKYQMPNVNNQTSVKNNKVEAATIPGTDLEENVPAEQTTLEIGVSDLENSNVDASELQLTEEEASTTDVEQPEATAIPTEQEKHIDRIMTALSDKYELSPEAFTSIEDIAPTIGYEMQMSAIMSILLGTIFILLYITYRFKDFRFGVAAIIALLHDVLVVFAVYAVFRIPIDGSFVAAELTIIGYSINDTIVVFDRIRENKRLLNKSPLSDMVNTSITETFSRCINTSITTLITIVILYILGAEAIRNFTLALIVGVIAGTYSSLAIASPIWYEMTKKANSL